MQQGVLHHFPHAQATYRFTNRDKTALFTRQSIERFRTTLSCKLLWMRPTIIHAFIPDFTDLALTEAEHEWLRETCTYLTPDYLAFLAAYRYKPEQVRVVFVPVSNDGLLGNVEIEASGPWVETILWEVPLMACLSECYFQLVMTDWSYDNQEGMGEVTRISDDSASQSTRNRVWKSKSPHSRWCRFQRVWNTKTTILPCPRHRYQFPTSR